jgi:hypothetical protein
VRSLNFFQGMALVSAGGDVSPQDFAGFLRFAVACGRQRDAGHSRLISFIFCVERIFSRSGIAYACWRDFAQLHVKPAQWVPIWVEPSQFCNRR